MKTLFLAALAAVSFSAFADTDPNYSTTARHILAKETPRADFTAPAVKVKLESLEAELRYVFGKLLTEKGRETFFMEAGAVGRMEALVRYGGYPAIYKFTVGWGDCPSGCLAQHSWYYEVYRGRGVFKIGEIGSPLDGEEGKGLFND